MKKGLLTFLLVPMLCVGMYAYADERSVTVKAKKGLDTALLNANTMPLLSATITTNTSRSLILP